MLPVVYFLSEKPSTVRNSLFYVSSISVAKKRIISKILHSTCGLFIQLKAAALQRSVAGGLGGVTQIRLHFFSDKT